jgi:signal peptidase I
VRSIVSAILLGAVCVTALLVVVFPLLLGAQSYTVLTGSMRPSREPGALIAVRQTDAAQIRIGDVITFQLRSGEPQVATHRVIAVGVDGTGDRVFTTRGDANDAADPRPVRAVQVRGVLVYAVPWIGYLNVWATPTVKSMLVVALGAGAIAWGAATLVRDSSRRRRVALAASAVLLAAFLPLLVPTAPASAAERGLIQISQDGTTWTDRTTLALLDASMRIVPGDTMSARFWVRSRASDDGLLTVLARWQPKDPSDARDVALSRALSAQADAPAGLSPGEVGEVEIRLSLPDSARMQTARGSSELLVHVSLVQDAVAEDLPRTGAEPPLLLLAGAGALFLFGAVLATRRRVR